MANVVAIDSARQSETPLGEERQDTGTAAPRPSGGIGLAQLVVEAEGSPARGYELGPKDLYPDAEPSSPLAGAAELLGRAKTALQAARATDSTIDFFSFDEELITAHLLLKKAFRFRRIGDGYAAIINALNWALANRGPTPLDGRQLGGLVGAIDRALVAPFMHFDTAMTIIDELENLDLDIEPPILDAITSDLDE